MELKRKKGISFDAQSKSKNLMNFDKTISEEEPKGSREDCEPGEHSSSLLQKKTLTEEEGNKSFDESSVCLKNEQTEFNKEKAKLREYFKKLKVGMITWNSIPEKYQSLLIRYYGIKEE